MFFICLAILFDKKFLENSNNYRCHEPKLFLFASVAGCCGSVMSVQWSGRRGCEKRLKFFVLISIINTNFASSRGTHGCYSKLLACRLVYARVHAG